MISMNDDREQVHEGKWHAHPPMRNALFAGLTTGQKSGKGILDHVVDPCGAYRQCREGKSLLGRGCAKLAPSDLSFHG